MWKKSLFKNSLEIKADRWPWMARTSFAMMSSEEERTMKTYGWKATRGTGRFGAGWNYCFSIRSGGWTKAYGISVYFELIYGTFSIVYHSKAYREKLARQEREKAEAAIRAAQEADDKKLRDIERRQVEADRVRRLSSGTYDDIPF